MSDPLKAYQALYGTTSRLAKEYLANPDNTIYSVGTLFSSIWYKITSLVSNGIGSLRNAENGVGNQYVSTFTETETSKIGSLLGSNEVIFDFANCNFTTKYDSSNPFLDTVQVSWFPNPNFAAYKICVLTHPNKIRSDSILSTGNLTTNNTPDFAFGSVGTSPNNFNTNLTTFVVGSKQNTVNISMFSELIANAKIYIFGHTTSDPTGPRSRFPSTCLTVFQDQNDSNKFKMALSNSRECFLDIPTGIGGYVGFVCNPHVYSYTKLIGVGDLLNEDLIRKYIVNTGLIDFSNCHYSVDSGNLVSAHIAWTPDSNYVSYKVCWKIGSSANSLLGREIIVSGSDQSNDTNQVIFYQSNNDISTLGFSGDSGLITTPYTYDWTGTTTQRINFFVFGYTSTGIRSLFPEVCISINPSTEQMYLDRTKYVLSTIPLVDNHIGTFYNYNTLIPADNTQLVSGPVSCFLGFVVFLTKNGYIAIDNIQAGMEMLQPDGSYSKVVEILKSLVTEISDVDDRRLFSDTSGKFVATYWHRVTIDGVEARACDHPALHEVTMPFPYNVYNLKLENEMDKLISGSIVAESYIADNKANETFGTERYFERLNKV